MNLRLTPAITIMAMLMMGIALITMAPHQAEAQSNQCKPQNLEAQIVSGDPYLTWDPPTNCTVESYDVYRRERTGDGWQGPGGWNGTIAVIASQLSKESYTDTSVEPGSRYRYRIQAHHGTKWSHKVDVTVPEEPPPPAKKGTTPTNNDDTTTRDAHDTPDCNGIWCATLTVRNLANGNRGCGNASNGNECTVHLSEDEFTHGDATYEIHAVRDQSDGWLEFWLDQDIEGTSQFLTLHIGSKTFALNEADEADGRSRKWQGANLDWETDDEIELRLSEVNIPPEFNEGDTASRSFSETLDDTTVQVATNIGGPVVATDLDTNNTVTYTLEGTDAAKFDIVSTNGQLQTKVGATYNYEQQQSYSVTVKAEDDEGAFDTIDVTLNVTDLDETPPILEFTLSALLYNSGVQVLINECTPTPTSACSDYHQIEYRKVSDQTWPGVAYSTGATSKRYSPDIYTYNMEPLEANVTYEFRVRGHRKGQRGDWAPSQRQSTIDPADIPDPVIRLSFNEFETEYDAGGNVVNSTRLNQIDILEGFDHTISIKAECDPCHGVDDIIVPIHYSKPHPDLAEAHGFQKKVTIHPSDTGTTQTISLDWENQAGRPDLIGDKTVVVSFGKITIGDVTKRVCTTQPDDEGNPVETCEDVTEEDVEIIVPGLDIPHALEGAANGQGKTLRIKIHDHDPDRNARWVISNSATEFPSNLNPLRVSGPTKTNDGVKLVWDMKRVHGIEYYDWNSKRDLTCHLAYMEVESTGRDLVDADGREQAEEVKWLLYPYTSPHDNLHVTDHGSGDNRWKRFTFTDIHTVGRTGTIANYSLRGAFNCPGIARYSETLVINSLVRLP